MSNRLRATSVAILALCCTVAAQQADRAPAEDLDRRAADRLRELHEEADRLAAQQRTVLGQLRRLELDREIKTEEFRRAQSEGARLSDELIALDRQIKAIEEEERSEIPELEGRLVSLYKLGRGRYLKLLLSTADVRQLGQATRLVAMLSDQDRARISAHHEHREQLTAARQTLQERQARLVAVRAGIDRARVAADQAVAARNALVREIDQRRDLNAQLLGELYTAQQNLQSTVAGMPGAAPSLPIGPFRGDLEWPVNGTVRQRFGSGRTVNTGIDIAAAEGIPVHAVHAGTVAFADVFTGFGRLVILDHGGQTFSLYGNLQDIAVTRGVSVQRGEVVGAVGVAPTGASGLYFELRVDGRPVDPLQWLKQR